MVVCLLPVKKFVSLICLVIFISSLLLSLEKFNSTFKHENTKVRAVNLSSFETPSLKNPSLTSPFNRYLSQEVGSSAQVLGTKTEGPAKEVTSKTTKSRMSRATIHTPNAVIVKFRQARRDIKAMGGLKKAQDFAASKKLIFKQTLKDQNIGVYEFTTGSAEDLALKLKKDPDVEYTEPNYQLELHTIPTNDTSKADLWGLDNTGQTVSGISGTADADIDIPEAWTISTGTSTVLVADDDTGVEYTHEDLVANMWDGSSCKDEDGNSIPGGCIHGYDYSGSGDNDPDPTVNPYPGEYWHGSHVAGTIGAVGNNSKGIVGVARNVRILALKSDLYFDELVKSIDFARQNGAKVINASWGGPSYSQALYDAISRFRDAGGLFITSAGNSTKNHDTNHSYPCDYNLDNIICVAATDQDDALASFSDYGASYVHVGAPGTNILSTLGPGNSYDYWNGTSMAAPHVTGLVALIWSYNTSLTYSQVRNIILTSGDSLPSLSGKTTTGKRINAYNALLAADFTAPTLTGLTSDTTYRKSKTWTWDSDDPTATYRYSIDQSPSWAPSGTYSSTKTATQSSGEGTYYVHVQATDLQGNTSAVTSVSALLDNTTPTVNAGADVTITTSALFTRTATAYDGGSGIASYLWTKQSGAGTITFGTPNAIGTTIGASANGVYVIRLTVADNATNSNYGEFTLTWALPGPTIGGVVEGGYYNVNVNPTFSDGTATLNGNPFNSGDTVSTEGTYTLIATNTDGSTTVHFTMDKTNPIVNAGTDASVNAQYTQNATTSDALSGIAIYQWSKTSGPGTVTFGSANSEDTTVTANADGTYIVRLTVTDNATNQAYDEFTLTWDTLGPNVGGVADGNYYKVDVSPTFTEGTATLNGNPFTSGTAVSTEMSYTLVVTDTIGNTTTVHFTVDKTAPTVSAGSDEYTNAQFSQDATASDSLSGIASYLWTKTSGPGTLTFGSVTSEDTTISASADGTYVIRLTATDRATNSNYGEFTLLWDTTGPTVIKLGTGLSDYTISAGGSAVLSFNEAIGSVGRSSVQSALTAGADQTITYTWDDPYTNLTIHGNPSNITTFKNDATALVYDELGNLSTDLMLIDSALDLDQVAAGTSTLISSGQTQAVVTTSQPSTIYVPIEVSNATVNVDPMITGLSGTIPAVTISTTTSAGIIVVEIPASTNIAAAGAWDAIINAPSIRDNSTVTIPHDASTTVNKVTVFELGAGTNKLTLDKASRLTIPNQAGKSVGYSHGGIFTAITSPCGLDSQSTGNALPAGGDCKINSGPNLIVWTKHFTDFVTYDQIDNDVTAPTKPVASIRGGDYSYDPVISLTSTDSSNFTIYMTLDNSTPDTTKQKYDKSFRLTFSATLKAVAIDIYGNVSPILVEGYNLAPGISQEKVYYVSGNNVVIRWVTDDPSRSRLVYDLTSHNGLVNVPKNYGYAFSSPEENTVLLTNSHEIALNSLKPATTYYYRAISASPPETAGAEQTFTTLGKKLFNSKNIRNRKAATGTTQRTATPEAQIKGVATESATTHEIEVTTDLGSQKLINKTADTVRTFLATYVLITLQIGIVYIVIGWFTKPKDKRVQKK